jgi:cytochrome P450
VLTSDPPALIPPMPRMASDDITGTGVLRAMRHNAFEAFPQKCWEEPVLQLSTPVSPLAILSAPEAIRHVLLDHHSDYSRLPVGKRVLSPVVGRGLLVSEGDAWRKQRKVMAPAFAPDKIEQLTSLIAVAADNGCRQLEQHRDTPEDLFSFFQSLSLDIGATVMFSADLSSIARELRELITFYMTRIGSPSVSDFMLPAWVPNVLSARRAIFRRKWRNLLSSTIATRRRAYATEGVATNADLFDLLEQAHGDRPGDLLADEISTMLVAGHETTALTLFWACALLSHAPKVQADLAAESAAVDWHTFSNPAADGLRLPDLPLMRSFVQETLRLYPPGFLIARLALKDHAVCGQTLRKGTMILIPLWMLHRNPTIWHSAESFDPWRFTVAAPGRFDYLPFGVGPHVCIGAQLALTEVTLVLSRLLHQNSIAPVKAVMPQPVGRLSTRPSFSPLLYAVLQGRPSNGRVIL